MKTSPRASQGPLIRLWLGYALILTLLLGYFAPLQAMGIAGGGNIPDDKVMHFLAGGLIYQTLRYWGWEDRYALLGVATCSLLKESYDLNEGGDCDINDILATYIGALTFKLADGIYFKIIYKGR